VLQVNEHSRGRDGDGDGERKLDEIFRSSPSADNSLITLDEAPDDELKAATAASHDARRDARRDPGAEPSPGHPGLDTWTLG
jgi:low affinity Fe/Cu permease